MDIDLITYKPLFLTSAKENLLGMQEAVAVLSSNASDHEAIADLFIKSHSLKGQSMTMGYTGIAKVCLAIEHYFRAVRDEQRPFDSTVLPSVAKACEAISTALTGIEQQDKEPLLAAVITNLEQTLGVKV